MQQLLQTTTYQYPQNEFDESIIYALATKMYQDSDMPGFSTEEIFKINIWKFKPGRRIKESSVTREIIDLSSNLNENFIYQDRTLIKRLMKLITAIGSRLFNRLSEDQKILMARTAGVAEFKRKIDINSVYDYIEAYES